MKIHKNPAGSSTGRKKIIAQKTGFHTPQVHTQIKKNY
jgi:hypothetical protein